MTKKLTIGCRVVKTTGYPFYGEIRSVFKTRAGLVRYVVEATGVGYSGMLHIFSPNQIDIDNDPVIAALSELKL